MHTPEYVARVHSGELTKKVSLDFTPRKSADGDAQVLEHSEPACSSWQDAISGRC